MELFGPVLTHMGAGQIIPIHERLFDRLELLTVSEVCAILRCHEKTLYQWVKKGALTAIRVGSKLKFDPADVAAFIISRRTQNSPTRRRI
jgi:excisionase family DNA binding protein